MPGDVEDVRMCFKQDAMKLVPFLSITSMLIILLLLPGCGPRQGPQSDESSKPLHLLANTDVVSEITVSHIPRSIESGQEGNEQSLLVQAIQAGGEKIVVSVLSDDIYAHLEAAVESETRRYLLESGRMSDGDGIELHVEITHLRLRRTVAQLLLSFVAGNDELSVTVTLARNGDVFASDSLSTRLQSGGMYGTLSMNKRLDFLAQQIARKLVKSRL